MIACIPMILNRHNHLYRREFHRIFVETNIIIILFKIKTPKDFLHTTMIVAYYIILLNAVYVRFSAMGLERALANDERCKPSSLKFVIFKNKLCNWSKPATYNGTLHLYSFICLCIKTASI